MQYLNLHVFVFIFVRHVACGLFRGDVTSGLVSQGRFVFISLLCKKWVQWINYWMYFTLYPISSFDQNGLEDVQGKAGILGQTLALCCECGKGIIVGSSSHTLSVSVIVRL